MEVWCEGEARRGLTPIARRVWAPCSRNLVARSTHRHERSHVYGFAHPPAGRSEWLILPTVNVWAMN